MHSHFFEGMFFGDFADRNKDEVELPTVTAAQFGLFLEAIAPVRLPLTRMCSENCPMSEA